MSNELAIVSLVADEFLSGDSSSKASSHYSDMSLDARGGTSITDDFGTLSPEKTLILN